MHTSDSTLLPARALPRSLAATSTRSRWRAGAAFGLAVLQALAVGSAAAGSLSQAPLTSQVSQPAKPNVVFTVDDSGSMQVHFMPEGPFTLNGGNVSFPSGSADTTYYMTDGFPGERTHEGGWDSAGTVSALKDGGETVYQLQFRSPDVNTIFYNPDVTYLPWVNTTGVRWPAATPAAARWEPTDRLGDTSTFDLTTNVTYGSNAYYWMSATYTRSTTFGQVCSRGVCKVPFYPGLVYRLISGANPTLPGSYVRYDINDPANYAADPKHPNRADCVAARCTQAEERQNFANWFTYYRTRLLLTKGSVAEVLNSTGNTLRVGLASINTVIPTDRQKFIDGVPMNVMRMPVRDLTNAQRDNLLKNLRTMAADGGTPLKSAIDEVGSNYFMRTDAGNPWRDNPDPQSGNSNETQCRRSYNILMTDGYYNSSDAGIVTRGNVDNTDGPNTYVPDPALKTTTPAVPAAYGYLRARPYMDGAYNTLADHAMYYYVNDLNTSLANRITPTKGRANAPYWQHLTQFTVGLGVKGDLDSRSEPLNAAGKSPKQLTLEKITAGTLSWPAAIDTDARKIDDLWHAAVDTGGEFFSAKNSTELTASLVAALGSAGRVNRSEGGVGATSAALVAGALKFVPSYQSSSWTGDLKAYKLVQTGNIYAFNTTPEWEAAKKVPGFAARNLVTFDGSSGYTFDNTMPVALRDLVTTASNQASLISYLRGDASQEGEVSPKFRRREGPLPDFVNSTPVYVKGLLDEGYASLAGTQGSSYAAFLARKSSRPGVTYVGGNGGFVHGFAEADGTEVFGYAPKAVLPNMKQLAALDYGSATNFHRYFVDGPQIEADAYVPSRAGGAEGWRNLLLGTLGAGGQAIYGLDVTLPGSLGVDTVQWEFASSTYPAIGNIFTAPEVGRVGGRWMAFFGNGAYSSGGKAVLLAVDLKDRSLKQFELEATLGNNGLMGVRLIRNAQLEVLAAYAGDLQGDLWRVDFQGSADTANWKKSFNGSPLFIAKAGGVRQPISVKPAVMAHSDGGTMVLFGTGKLFDTEDSASTTKQTFYGIWDKTLAGQSAATADASGWNGLANQRTQLLEQTINKKGTVGADGDTYYNVSANTMDATKQRGWYIDLNIVDGQRVVYPAVTVKDFVLMQTMVPAGTPAVCDSSSGRGFDFLLRAQSGGQSDKPVWDSNGDGVVDSKDETGAGYGTDADGVNVVMSSSTSSKCLSVGASGSKGCDTGGTLKIRDRVWRQIVNPPQPN